MSALPPLPRLAAMYLTHGHRIPTEILSTLPSSGDVGGHALDEWECPLADGREFGASRCDDGIRIAPPSY